MTATGGFDRAILAAIASDEKPAYRSAAEQGMKGTLLPPADYTGMGGSTGFNARELLPINIDPDQAGGYVLQPGQVKGGVATPAPMGSYDKQEVREHVSKRMKSAAIEEAKVATPAPVVPPAPVRRQRKPKLREEIYKEEEFQVPSVFQAESVSPSVKIAFDFGPMGEMETCYHAVWKEGNNLVLGWDVNCKNANRYKPGISDKPIKVTVGGETYMVMNLGIQFTDIDLGRQYTILLIDMRA